MSSLGRAIQSIYEELDYEAAQDSGASLLCDIDTSRAVALYRGLSETTPERLANVVVRTLSWSLLSPGATADDGADVRAIASTLRQWQNDGLPPRTAMPARAPGSLRSLAWNAQRTLIERDPLGFAGMLADFRATRLGGLEDWRRAKVWTSWMDDVVMVSHGTTLPELFSRLEELSRSDVIIGGPTTYEPALPEDATVFGEVWRNGPHDSLERCVLQAFDVTVDGGEMYARLNVDPPLANPLAVEYLFEEELLWRAFARRFRDRIRVVHYDVEGRRWSHVVG